MGMQKTLIQRKICVFCVYQRPKWLVRLITDKVYYFTLFNSISFNKY